mmetsp:Transcript_9747/g.27219  ORF Transcript_9747/g.27219 Transcript_9747/m.27219 type:complete len:261 (+) Transcript_9747:763-1545(+)
MSLALRPEICSLRSSRVVPLTVNWTVLAPRSCWDNRRPADVIWTVLTGTPSMFAIAWAIAALKASSSSGSMSSLSSRSKDPETAICVNVLTVVMEVRVVMVVVVPVISVGIISGVEGDAADTSPPALVTVQLKLNAWVTGSSEMEMAPGSELALPSAAPGLGVQTNQRGTAPPLSTLSGATDTSTLPSATTVAVGCEPMAGAPPPAMTGSHGKQEGSAHISGEEPPLVPTSFTAMTLTVYDSPSARPSSSCSQHARLDSS